MAQLIKNQPATQETWVRSLGWELPWGRSSHSSILHWENSMDCTVHGVTKNRTQLSDFHLALAVSQMSPVLDDLASF